MNFKDLLACAIEDAIAKYTTYHVDIYVEEDEVFLMYSSRHNSFPITETICTTNDISLQELEQIADEYDIGWVF